MALDSQKFILTRHVAGRTPAEKEAKEGVGVVAGGARESVELYEGFFETIGARDLHSNFIPGLDIISRSQSGFLYDRNSDARDIVSDYIINLGGVDFGVLNAGVREHKSSHTEAPTTYFVDVTPDGATKKIVEEEVDGLFQEVVPGIRARYPDSFTLVSTSDYDLAEDIRVDLATKRPTIELLAPVLLDYQRQLFKSE